MYNNTPTPDHLIQKMRTVDSILYGTTLSGLYKSIDDGDSWSNVFVDSAFSWINVLFCRDSIIAVTGSQHAKEYFDMT